MKRRLLDLLATLSFGAAVLVAAAGVRSCGREDGFRHTVLPRPGWYREWRVMSGGGIVAIIREEVQTEYTFRAGSEFFHQDPSPWETMGPRGLAGFYVQLWSRPAARPPGVQRQVVVELPYWFGVAACLALPFARLYRRRRGGHLVVP